MRLQIVCVTLSTSGWYLFAINRFKITIAANQRSSWKWSTNFCSRIVKTTCFLSLLADISVKITWGLRILSNCCREIRIRQQNGKKAAEDNSKLLKSFLLSLWLVRICGFASKKWRKREYGNYSLEKPRFLRAIRSIILGGSVNGKILLNEETPV